jgi:4-amino-4-deoxy-L-arabinose transferase-like glycosyltransferase
MLTTKPSPASWFSTTRLLWAALIVLCLAGLAVRFYDLTDPPLQFHGSRQLRGAIIARGLYYQSLPEADEARRAFAAQAMSKMAVYEPPVFEALVAVTYRLAGEEILWAAGVYSILFWAVGGAGVYLLGRRLTNAWAALTGLAFCLCLPFGVVASRAFQPDPFMVMWLVWAAYALYRWQESLSWRWVAASGLLAGMATLVKPVAALPLLAAMGLVVVFGNWQVWREAVKSKAGLKTLLSRVGQAVGMLAVMAILPGIYYLGIAARSKEFLEFWTVSLGHLIFTPGFYLNWVTLVARLMGWHMLVLAAAGLVLARRPARPLLWGLWVGYGLYGLFLPYQIMSHNYYHLMVIPFLALAIMPVAERLFAWLEARHWVWRAAAAVLVAAMAGYGIWRAGTILGSKDYRGEPERWQEISAALPRDGKVIALAEDYGHRLLYYGWRNTSELWPGEGDQYLAALRNNPEQSFEDYFLKRTQGMSYFLVTRLPQLESQAELKDWLYGHYALIVQGEDYLIFDLEAAAGE